jgi:hypothetical protein
VASFSSLNSFGSIGSSQGSLGSLGLIGSLGENGMEDFCISSSFSSDEKMFDEMDGEDNMAYATIVVCCKLVGHGQCQ